MSNYGTVTRAGTSTVTDLYPGFSSNGCIGINPNGGTISHGGNTTSGTTTWYLADNGDTWNSSYNYQIAVTKISITRSGYHISGFESDSNNSVAHGPATYDGTTLSVIVNAPSSSSKICHLKVLWASDGGTAPGGPGGVRIGASSSYSSNSTSAYAVNISSPGGFYITWTAGSAGTGNAVSGYERRVIRASDNSVISGTTQSINSTSTLYSWSSGYANSLVGVPLKAQVRTKGSGGLYSSWVTSANTITFTQTTTTAPGAPSGVRVGTSSSYSSNSASNYNIGAPSPGEFYITWTAGSNGTNNAIAGYRRRVIRVSNNEVVSGTTSDINSTSTFYNKSTSWLASAVGQSYKAQVQTLGSVSGVDSNWVTSSNTITFTSSTASGHTLTANANGGSPNRTYTGSAFTHQSIESPTRANYGLYGWYFDSTASNCLDYGTSRAITGSNIKITFWTDATTYAQGGTTSTICSIFSCAESGGYTVCNENGNWEFQVHDGSGWKKAGVAASSIAAGYHEWCCIANVTEKKIYLYIDGTLKAQTSLTNAQISYNASYKKLLLGGELAGNGMKSGSGFVGKIGNFKLVYSSSTYSYSAPDYDVFDIPEQDATVYAYWKRNGYTLTVRPNGGIWNGSTSDSTLDVVYGTRKTIAAPTRAGYDFIGWASVGATFSNDYSAGTTFFTSLPGKYCWSGATGDHTLSLVDMDTGSGFTTATKMLQIVEPGTSPKGVGWYRTCALATSTAIIVAFVAKAPTNTYFIVHNSETYQGTGYTYEYLTPMAGTGKWQTYCIKFVTGNPINTNSTGYFILCGNQDTISMTTNPGAVTYQVAWQNIGLANKINSSEEYVPNSNLTSDTITAVWIEKKYDISYNLNGGVFPSDLDTVDVHYGNSVEAVNPLSAQWNRSPYVMGNHPASGSGKPTAHSPNYWFYVERPTKSPSISETTTTITTSFSAATSVSSLNSNKTVITSIPQNFYSWTITGMNSGISHQYYGRTSTGATTNAAQSFTSTSIIVTGTNHTSGQPPLEYRNLSSTGGDVVFTAGWTPGTTTTSTLYGSITLPSIPTKANGSTSTTRTVSYNANGGNSTPSSQSVTPTATITYSHDSKWWTTSTAGTSYSQGTAYTPTTSGTLYAHYTASTSSYSSPTITLPAAITFDPVTTTIYNDGTVNYNAASSVTPSTIEVATTSTQLRIFDKWRLNSATGISYAAGATYTPTATSATFYATSTPNGQPQDVIAYSSVTLPTVPSKADTTISDIRTVNYNANGGSSTPTAQFVTPTATVTWSDDDKWYTSEIGGTGYTQGTTYTPTAATTTLYAHYDPSTGTFSSPTLSLRRAISKASTTATYPVTFDSNGSSTTNTTITTTLNVSYTFDKWRLGSTTGASYSAGATFTPTVSSTTMYATFNQNEVADPVISPVAPTAKDNSNTSKTITFNPNGGSVTPTVRNTVVSNSWKFGGWATTTNATTGIAANTSFTPTTTRYYASWTTNTITASPISTPIPTRTGFTCTGWYTSASGGTKRANAGGSYTPPITGETIYAQWTRQGAARNMYVFNGSAWKVATPYVFNGSQWKRATAYVFDGSEWKQSSTFPD